MRRLNPFLGVLQVVETPARRASSLNGLVWHIELFADKPAGSGSLGSDTREQGWYLHSIWSEKDGLVTLPMAATGRRMQAPESTERIIDAVKANNARLPLALADRRELWLLDALQGKPLALKAENVNGVIYD